jgi:hypothetical protein
VNKRATADGMTVVPFARASILMIADEYERFALKTLPRDARDRACVFSARSHLMLHTRALRGAVLRMPI